LILSNHNRIYPITLAIIAIAATIMVGCDNDGSDSSTPDVGDNDPMLCVAVGDSITDGLDGIGYPEILAAMSGKTVINFGEQGQTSEGGIRTTPSALSQQPGFLLILYGANDVLRSRSNSLIIENLRTIIRLAKDNQTIPVIATLTPIIGRGFSSAVESLNRDIRALANEEAARLVDLEEAFGGDPSLLLSDGLHPNNDGEELMAKAFANKL
jgi:acyl-CoA thioesterase-1